MPENFWTTRAQPSIFLLMCLQNLTVVVETNMHFFVQCADKSLARPGRKQAIVSVRMAWISFGALPCKKKKTLWKFASRCCWNRARPWHASELVSFLVGLGTYQNPVCLRALLLPKNGQRSTSVFVQLKLKFSLCFIVQHAIPTCGKQCDLPLTLHFTIINVWSVLYLCTLSTIDRKLDQP